MSRHVFHWWSERDGLSLPVFIRDADIAFDVVLGPFVNLYGCTVGPGTRIGAFVEIQAGARIGARCKIGSHSFLCAGLVVEDEVFIGHGVMTCNDDRPRATCDDGKPAGDGDWTCEPPTIGRGASIGSGAVILAGITIGAGAIVGAGAVVTHDVPPGATVAGNPARSL